jgi:glycosyltransferase involved in cell wall biosynthesis
MEPNDSLYKTHSVLIIDPALKSRAGHHLNITKALIAIIESQGWEARVLVSLWAEGNIKQELGATGSFHHTLYHRRDWTQLGFKRHSFAFAEILRRQIIKWKTLPSVVIFPCCDQVQYNGFAKVVSDLELPWRPAVFAWHMLPPRIDLGLGDIGSAPQQDEYKTAFRNIKSALGNTGALYIATETKSLAKTYSELSGLTVTLLRIPSILEDFTPPSGRQLLNPIHVVVTGHANVSKGYELLPAALSGALLKRPNLRITVHGTISGTAKPKAMMKTFKAIKEAGPCVKILTSALDINSYYDLLRSASLLLLPYDPKIYKNKGSGIFDESMILGIPTIAPVDCEFAVEAIDGHRAIGIKAHSPPAISDAIIKAVDSYGQLATQAHSYALQLGEKKNPTKFILAILNSSKAGDLHGLNESIWQRVWHGFKYLIGAIVSLVP